MAAEKPTYLFTQRQPRTFHDGYSLAMELEIVAVTYEPDGKNLPPGNWRKIDLPEEKVAEARRLLAEKGLVRRPLFTFDTTKLEAEGYALSDEPVCSFVPIVGSDVYIFRYATSKSERIRDDWHVTTCLTGFTFDKNGANLPGNAADWKLHLVLKKDEVWRAPYDIDACVLALESQGFYVQNMTLEGKAGPPPAEPSTDAQISADIRRLADELRSK